jgi:hypothetical protein
MSSAPAHDPAMRNWYCLVNFPDGTRGVHLVPGPAPVQQGIIKILGIPGHWLVKDIDVRVEHLRAAAEIWVEEHEPGSPQPDISTPA